MASLYQQTVPVFIKYLKALDGILTKGMNYAGENEVKHEDLINHRLVPDMRGLAYQVQSCSDTARFVVSRVGKIPHVAMEDNETTFEELVMETKMGNFGFTCQSYVSEFAIPNFHFHLSTAYCILRVQKVPLSAFDYLHDVFHKMPVEEEKKGDVESST